MRLIRRCKNINELRVNCAIKLSADFFFCLRTLGNLSHLAITSQKILAGTDLASAQEVLIDLSKHVTELKLKTLSVYELNEKLTNAYSKSEEKAEMLESLRFATINQKDGFELLHDLVFFTNLRQLAICYNERDCMSEDIEIFNSEILGNLLLEV